MTIDGYRHQYGEMMKIGDSLRKFIIQHKSGILPSRTVPEDVAAKKLNDVERGAAYYARASAFRAVHGILPPGNAEADSRYWHAISDETRDEMIKMVVGIFAAAMVVGIFAAANPFTYQTLAAHRKESAEQP